MSEKRNYKLILTSPNVYKFVDVATIGELDVSLLEWINFNVPQGSSIFEIGTDAATDYLRTNYNITSCRPDNLPKEIQADCVIIGSPNRSGLRSAILDIKISPNAIVVIDEIYNADDFFKSILTKLDVSYIHEGNKWAAVWPKNCIITPLIYLGANHDNLGSSN